MTFGLKLHCRLSSVSSLLIYPADPGTGQPLHSHVNQYSDSPSLLCIQCICTHVHHPPTASVSLENSITLYTNIPYSSPMSLSFHSAATKWPRYAFFLSYLSPNRPPGQMSRKWDGVGWREAIKPLKEATGPSGFSQFHFYPGPTSPLNKQLRNNVGKPCETQYICKYIWQESTPLSKNKNLFLLRNYVFVLYYLNSS